MVTAARPAAPKPRKIAVLGGGMGALSAVYELTRDADWQERHDITVYQIGWRLGGKGASGRNMEPGFHHRIEEHGVHVFFGFYTNAFRLMEACYKELGRPAGSPLATWEDAFKGMNHIVVPEKLPNGQWDQWSWDPPPMAGTPTDDRSEIGFVQCFETIAVWFRDALSKMFSQASPLVASPQVLALKGTYAAHGPAIEDLASRGVAAARQLSLHTARAGHLVQPFGAVPLAGLQQQTDAFLSITVEMFEQALRWFWLVSRDSIVRADSDFERQVRKTWIICNFIYANLHGIQKSGVLSRGIESLNQVDYLDWIEQHARPDNGATSRSVLTRWIYDAVFSYRFGDITKPSLEAGTALLVLLRILFTYSGDFLYKMQSGMGDIVFAPLYEVLRKRGVKFAFFHRVVELEVGQENGASVVSRITFERQAKPKDAADAYAPLVPILDREGLTLPCWPSEPDYRQLQDGTALRQSMLAAGSSLEAYAVSPHAETLVLAKGEFDDVILGIGLGALPAICKELADANADWKTMMAEVGTVATLGAQLWTKRDLSSLASGQLARPGIFCGFDYDRAPIDTYSPMTQVLARESWPLTDEAPKGVAYFCSPLNDAPATEGTAGAKQVRALALTLLQQQIRNIWPRSLTAAGHFDWNLLVDMRAVPGAGAGRLESQYFVGVANRSDRYVATFKDSSRHRLWPHRTGFRNLVITGDWVRNSLNVGCIEATVMTGMQAANVVRGRPVGEGIAGWGLLCSAQP
ncbi:MAG: acetoacetate decarboxylase [Ramlibacter sp.]|nr:acetoacetate decarboxylase [Ramlibacter sp.]